MGWNEWINGLMHQDRMERWKNKVAEERRNEAHLHPSGWILKVRMEEGQKAGGEAWTGKHPRRVAAPGKSPEKLLMNWIPRTPSDTGIIVIIHPQL